MFGQDWDKAEATIVNRDAKFSGSGATATHTFVADVRLSSGESFRATVHEPNIATDFWPPGIGDVVSVLVKSKDRKVKFDMDDERLSVKAHHAAKKTAFGSVQQQPAGTPPVSWATATSPQMPDGIPPEVAAKLAQLGITGAAPMVVTGDSAQGQAILAAMSQAGVAPAAAAHTPEVRLAKLQTLLDQGLLSDDEYAAQRRRILDEI
jgi:hypothetical protein